MSALESLEKVNRILNLLGIETRVEKIKDKSYIFFKVRETNYKISEFFDYFLLHVGDYEYCPVFDFKYIYCSHNYPDPNCIAFSFHKHRKLTIMDGNIPDGSFKIRV